MTTVEQIRTEIEQFKATVVSGVDGLAAAGYISANQGSDFLATVGIERPEAAEVREAREELAALKARVREAIEAQETDEYRRSEAKRRLGL